MQDAQVGAGMFQHFVAQDIDILHTFVLHEVGEAFALHTGHVKDVRIGYYLFRKVGVLHKSDVVFAAVNLVLFRHFQFFGSDEMKGGVEVPHGHQQGVYGAAVFQIAYQVDVQVLQRTLRLVDGVEVEHRLRGMLVGSVSGIDDGHCGYFAGIACGSFQVVAHYDDVGIVAYHLDGIFQCLAFGRAGSFGVAKADDTCTEPVGGGFKA